MECTHLCFSYCSLHEEAGTAVKKVKTQLDVVLKNMTMNTDIGLLSVSLLIDARGTKNTREGTKARTRAIFSHSRDSLELCLVKKQ